MTKVKVAAFAVSLDGYGAGPNQSLTDPLGQRGTELHGWFFPTKAFQRMHGDGNGTEGVDNDFGERSFDNLGAWIMGRNMFAPTRGAWTDDEWKGWWGENPPYHVPVFVLTHHERPPLELGDTTFHFVTDGVDSAVEQAKQAAGDEDVLLGGGAEIAQQCLAAGLVDEM